MESSVYPVKGERSDIIIATLLMWRQLVYTFSPLPQIILNEHMRRVPNLPFKAMTVRAVITIMQFAECVVYGNRYASMFRLPVLIKEGVFYAFFVAQYQWYRRNKNRSPVDLDQIE